MFCTREEYTPLKSSSEGVFSKSLDLPDSLPSSPFLQLEEDPLKLLGEPSSGTATESSDEF